MLEDATDHQTLHEVLAHYHLPYWEINMLASSGLAKQAFLGV